MESSHSAPATRDARASATSLVIDVPGAALNSMLLLSALAGQRIKLIAPLLFNGWHKLMLKHGLVDKYPNLLDTLQMAQ